MVKVKVTIEDTGPRHYIEQINASMQAEPYMLPIAEMMRSMQVDHFTKAVDSDGIAWPALSPITIERRRKGGGTGDPLPLLDTGRLRNSIFPRVAPGEAMVGTNVEYARVHQFGFKKIPKREFLYLNDEEQDRIVDFVSNYIFGKA